MKIIITQMDVPPPIPAGVAAGLVAAPGGQSGATVMTARVNIFTNVASGTGAKLQNILGNTQTVRANGAFPLNLFPSDGTQIDGYSLNEAAIVSQNSTVTFAYDGNTTWYVI